MDTGRWLGTVTAIIAVAGLAQGCSKPLPAGMTRVAGVVSYQGKPLPDGTINFEGKGGQGSATARIQSDGSFEAVMPPGEYQAMICSEEGVVTFDDRFRPIEPPSRIAKKYGQLGTSGLMFTVPQNGGRLAIDLE